MGAWSNSRELTRQSWAVLKENRYLMAYPVVGIAIGIVPFAIIAAGVAFIAWDRNWVGWGLVVVGLYLPPDQVGIYFAAAKTMALVQFVFFAVKAGATPTACGWIKDPFGLSWQIVPRRFMELIRDKDPKKVKAVMDAMMTMVKLDVAALERAYAEA